MPDRPLACLGASASSCELGVGRLEGELRGPLLQSQASLKMARALDPRGLNPERAGIGVVNLAGLMQS